MLDRVLDARLTGDELSLLTVISCFYALLGDVLALSKTSAVRHAERHPHITALVAMVDMVQAEYGRSLTLNRIAAAGNVGVPPALRCSAGI